MRKPLAEVLASGERLLFDGAMGTMLYQKGVFINRSYDALCFEEPDLVASVHAEYVRAGAQILETNTFGATRPHLAAHGLGDDVTRLNRVAAGLARRAAGEAIWVAGAIGPLGIRLEPYGPTALEEARVCFGEAVDGLLEGGVDAFVLETFSDLEEMHQAILAVRMRTTLPIIAQMTLQEDGRTSYGATPEEIARALDGWGADVVGLNCSVGPAPLLEAIERMAGITARPLSVQPNAGMPREVAGRKMYLSSPEYMARYARRLMQVGARLVGGCCGTTPEHVRLMADAVRARGPGRVRVVSREQAVPAVVAQEPPVPLAARSRLGARLASGEFVSSVELLPPRGVDVADWLERVRHLRDAGIDALNVPDGPRAQSRMSALAASVLLAREGLEPVVHYTCRDRNLLGMQSDLLGAAALGIGNLLLVTGDPPKMGPYPQATAVFDIDAIGLANMVRNLNLGLDLGGHPMGSRTAFCYGVGVNPAALDLEHELRRFAWKVEAGAQFAITQPVFDAAQFEAFLERARPFGIPIVAGIWPFASHRNAEFMANEVPGVSVPRELLRRMQRAEAGGAAAIEGVAIAREMLARFRGAIQGVQISAPLGRVDLALAVLT
ncbi:MAG: bifunctional homocysteine S-methyltransferase/methylenetetrahydrofolate reductase [Candidatus Sericytochromatia bacterium]|nr:bifunctional homocysteine S-methyltransferase/methylenetetrahydrofolate reductase [Candidatus Sericytochromatia bacterium]